MAFSTESISQPHDMLSGRSSAARFVVVSPVETEQLIVPGRGCRDDAGKEMVGDGVRRLRSVGEEDGRRVDCRKFEAFAIGEKVRREKREERRRVAMHTLLSGKIVEYGLVRFVLV